jgi:hypothetical protein
LGRSLRASGIGITHVGETSNPSKQASPGSVSLPGFIHALDQAGWAHVGPILVDEIQARGAAVRFVNDPPALRNFDEAWPKGMLSFLIDENVKDAVFIFERIGHFVLQTTAFRCLPSSLAIILPISAAGCGSRMAS